MSAVALADKLRSEGRTVIRRWKFLVVGANNEDDARELAEQIRREAPPDATVSAGRGLRALALHPVLIPDPAARRDTGTAAAARRGRVCEAWGTIRGRQEASMALADTASGPEGP